MAKDLVPVHVPMSNSLHPAIYAVMAGLLLVFVFWIWAAFDGSGYTDFLLAVVSGFFLMVFTIPFVLWRVRRKYSGDAPGADETLRDWSSHEFDIQPGPMQGKYAAVELLLPIAAVAFGMMAIAIVLLLVSHHIV
jgi:hypothetical protein